MEKITIELLKKISGRSEQYLAPFLQPLKDCTNSFFINTDLRMCHFFSQILHESGNFRWLEELSSGDQYDTRVDLGNTPQKDGDGKLFKGRDGLYNLLAGLTISN